MTKTKSHSGECRCNAQLPRLGSPGAVAALCRQTALFLAVQTLPSAPASPAQPAQPSPVRQCELANFHKT